MAEPFDSATYLEDVSSIAQTQYFPEFTEESPKLFGQTTNRLFSLDQAEVTGTGKTMQYELSRADTVRANSDPLGDFAGPDAFQAGSLTVRFNKQTTTSNDFTEMSASAQVDDIDVQEAGKGSIVDFVDRIYKQVQPNYEEHLAILRHLPRTAIVAALDGSTVARNNSWYFSGATATASNANGLRAIVTSGSIAALRPGSRIDFLNPTTFVVNAGNVRVTDVNPADKSIGVEFVTTGIAVRQSTGNLASVGTTDKIVFSGEYNKGLYSMGAWFARPTAGESFMGGVDRSTAAYRWMLPTSTREGATSTRLTKSMFNDLAIAMGWRSEDAQLGMVFMTDPQQNQNMRDEIGEDAFIQIPVDDSRVKRFANFGLTGLNYQHGQFGVVKIESDPLCPPSLLRAIPLGTWKGLYYGWKGLRAMKEGGAHWYRMTQATPNSGRGKIWKADWYSLQADICMQPWLNGQILNLSN